MLEKLLESSPLTLALVALVVMALGAVGSLKLAKDLIAKRRNGTDRAEEVTLKLAKHIDDRVSHKYERFKELLEVTDEKVDDHEARLRVLEGRKR